MIAEKQLDQIEKYIEALKIEVDVTHIQLTTFQLHDSVETWWKSIKNTKDTSDMTWMVLKELSLTRYLPQIVQDEKRKEFINLIQGTSTVTDTRLDLHRCRGLEKS